MNKYNKIKKSAQLFRRFTGITVEKFDEIMKELKPKYDEWNKQRLNNKNRKRKIGGGNKFKLSLEEKLLMLLMYYRLYVTHEFLGFIFDIDDSNVGRDIKPLAKLLAGIFKIPEERVKISEEEIIEAFVTDGTEQKVERPGKKQKQWYSGKKKHHTIKHQIIIAKIKSEDKEKLRIISVSKSFKGKVHDKPIYEQTKVRLPANIPKNADMGYLGTDLNIPIKKQKGKELSKEEKAYNKEFSSKRICVEHALGKMKIWKILAERYRNNLGSHSLVFKNIAGLHNLMFN
jgi:hypothetical protein